MRGDAGFPVRLRFAKRGKVRFISHRDVARAFERAFRIEQLPLAFTHGFSPRPKVSFGLALSLGYESDAEYLDVELGEPVAVESLPERLSAALPDGLAVTAVAALADRAPSLQESITSVEYRLALTGLGPQPLGVAVDRAWASTELPVTTTRKGKRVVEDVRPSISRLHVLGEELRAFDRPGEIDLPEINLPEVNLEVATKPRGVRPAEVITVLRELAGAEEPVGEDRVLRTCQWIERDGVRLEPLIADRRSPTPSGAGARALEVCA